MYISRPPKRVAPPSRGTAAPPAAATPRPARCSLIAVGNAVGKADGTTAEGKPASSSGQKRSWADNKEQEDKYKTEQELAMVPTFMHCSFHAL